MDPELLMAAQHLPGQRTPRGDASVATLTAKAQLVVEELNELVVLLSDMLLSEEGESPDAGH